MIEILLDPSSSLLFQQDIFKSYEISNLLKRVQWREDKIKFYGKEYEQPRKVAWMADTGVQYKYSNILMDPIQWGEEILEIKREVEGFSQTDFNSVLINLYRDGGDYMSWHCDNEKELGESPTIASVSFGVSRDFLLKSKFDSSLKYKFQLDHGSLLIMKGNTQKNWYHSLPKRLKIKEQRLNLTFRRIFHGSEEN